MKTVFRIFILAAFHLDMFRAHRNGTSQLLHRHKRSWVIEIYAIEEEITTPFSLGIVPVNNSADTKVEFQISGMGVDKEPRGVLRINRHTGELHVLKKVDREKHQTIELKFTALEVSSRTLFTQLGIDIEILDINDNAPTFKAKNYSATVKEGSTQGEQLVLVKAEDLDKPGTVNSTFTLRIVSQTPNTDNAQFFIDESGVISFRGCIDYEKAAKYELIVEAKDKGDKIQLSSSTTVVITVEDQNNNRPVLEGTKLVANVKERDSNVTLLRIKVSDRDKPHTPGWKAKYTIVSGNENKNYKILTDPDTNDGVLTLVKSLDYEDGQKRTLSVMVKNEIPYFTCTVKKVVADGLWELEKTSDEGSQGPAAETKTITIIVEDINDPPEFIPPFGTAYVQENSAVGIKLKTFTAFDRDASLSNMFRYSVGDDPAGWVSIDQTGTVTNKQKVDRESPYVKNNTYTVTLLAIDNGVPPLTGTATLVIYITDVNDNTPYLLTTDIEMCVGETSSANLIAEDKDEELYSGPFFFQLLEKESLKGKWKLESTLGYTVRLIKDKDVYSGVYVLHFKIQDKQGESSEQNLTVTVCECTAMSKCNPLASNSLGGRTIGVMLAALLLMLGILLLAIVGDKSVFTQIDGGDCSLWKSNTEQLGSDCQVATNGSQKRIYYNSGQGQMAIKGKKINWNESTMDQTCSLTNNQYDSMAQRIVFLISKRVDSLHSGQDDLLKYNPHPYADEGEEPEMLHLDAISIPDSKFSSDQLLDLGPKFKTLASICNRQAESKYNISVTNK
ncbi:cadherin-like protein 26 isoform X2 [Polyodon spathula]|uniref:cadherin-like protein 26 isoform X2 n=1 Tax=Polyodon spathula TaxID=7913 RepID=UPI001B7DDFFE|nr:cadherin-like protein 26 isoform X2 [Polyodon spathula]